MPIRNKILLAVSILMLPLLILLGMFIAEKNDKAEFSQKEIYGAEYNLTVKNLQFAVAKHRGTMSRVLNGEAGAKAGVSAMRSDITSAIADVDKVHEQFGVMFKVEDQWAEVKQKISATINASDGMSADASFTQHSDIINAIVSLSTRVGDNSNLILDPDLDSYYLMDIVTVRMPSFIDNLGKMRGTASTLVLQSKAISQQQIIQLTTDLTIINSDLGSIKQSMATAFENNDSLKGKLDVSLNDLVLQAEAAVTLVQNTVLGELSTTSGAVFEKFSSALQSSSTLFDNTTAELNTLLQIRVDGIESNRNISVVIVILLAIAALITMLWMVKMIVSRLQQAVEVAQRIEKGDFSQNVPLGSRDETGKLLNTMGAMQTLLKARIESDRQKAEINKRIAVSLDNATSNVMVVDLDYNIVFVNDAVQKMFAARESQIQGLLPNFSANKEQLLQTNIDVFHKNPAHQRKILDALTGPLEDELDINSVLMSTIVSPVMDGETRIGTVVEWVDVTDTRAAEKEEASRLVEERKLAAVNNQIVVALNNSSANVMIADNDFNIVFLNETCHSMFTDSEEDLRQDLPDFKVATLVGTNIDAFHQNPAHQRGMVEGLKEEFQGQITVGGHIFALNANPIIFEGEREGTVVEWEDITQQLQDIEAKEALLETQRVMAVKNAQVSEALNSARGSVMIADIDLNVIFLNKHCKPFLIKTAQP